LTDNCCSSAEFQLWRGITLSLAGKFSDKPVGGKVRSSEGEVPQLTPPPTNTTCLSCSTRRDDNLQSTATSNPSGTTDAVFTKLPRPLAKDRKTH